MLWFQVVVRGRPAHAGDAPIGLNAIEASYPVISALRTLEAELNVAPPPPYDVYEHPINLNVGMIRGGDWPSTVAAESVPALPARAVPGRARRRRSRRGSRTRWRRAARPRASTARVVLRRLRLRGLHARPRRAARDRARRTASEHVIGARPALIASTATTDARSFALYAGSAAVCFGPARRVDPRGRRAGVAAVGTPDGPDARAVR